MNNLQKLKTKKNYFVTINPIEVPNYIHNETFFTHPKFDFATHEAQKMLKDIQGIKNIFLWFLSWIWFSRRWYSICCIHC